MKKVIQSLINHLNGGFKTGKLSLMDINDSNYAEFGCEPGDIIVDTDFNDEDEPSEKQAYFEHMCALDITNQLMVDNGFKAVAEHDGSGGGLYYGFTAYRKMD